MDATEARRRASGIESERVREQYNDIKRLIDKAVNDGKFITTGYGSALLQGTKIKLEEEGYSVKESFEQRDGHMITIQW